MTAIHKSLNLCKVAKHIDYDLIDNEGLVIESRKSSLIQYLPTIKRTDRVQIPGDPNNKFFHLLSQDVLYLMIDLLQIAKDTFDANLCWQSLDENDIMILLDQGATPKLSKDVVFMPASRDAIDYCMLLLGEIFEHVILYKCSNMLGEVTDFLDLFKVDGAKNRDLIFVHCTLVHASAKTDYICNVQDFLKNHVKKKNRKHYNSILSAMAFPSDWEVHALANYLRDCYNSRNPGGGATSTGPMNPQTGNPHKSRWVKHMPSAQGSSARAQIKTVNSAATGAATPQTCSVILQKPAASKAVHLNLSNSNQLNIDSTPLHRNVQGISNDAILSGVPSSSGAGNKSSGGCGGASASQVVGASTGPTNQQTGNQHHLRKAQHTPRAQELSTRAQIKTINIAAAGTATPQAYNSTLQKPAAQSNAAMIANVPSSSGAGSTSKYNAPGSDPREEVLTFYRNVGRHGMDLSMRKGKLKYDTVGLIIMLLSLFPRLLSTLLKELHRLGYLMKMKTLPMILR